MSKTKMTKASRVVDGCDRKGVHCGSIAEDQMPIAQNVEAVEGIGEVVDRVPIALCALIT